MTNNPRKRKQKDVSAAPMLQLKPLQGHQIEAVTKTYNDLRAAGVDSVVELPATVVAGDTSSGKSSVMCRLTGLPFPRGEGVVTKFATEVDMMPADTEEIRVSIRPDKERAPEQSQSLLRFQRKIDLDQFEETCTEACNLMTHLGGRTLFADVLHISLKGPYCKPLTVIDLPGLIHAATQKVSDADRKLSEELAKRYVRETRTIVLAVITASNDVVNQAITRITRQYDRDGARTMGIVTKVDTVCGKAKDNQLFNILSNEEIPLRLGWHALVNTIGDDENASGQQITKAEQDFFEAARFKAIEKSTTGIDNLRTRVVQVVGEKLVNTLPTLKSDVDHRLAVMKAEQYKLGEPVEDLAAQRKLLMRICNRFQNIAQAGLDGVYSSELLLQTDNISNAAHREPLRSEIEALHHDFASAMRVYGATKQFKDLGQSSCHTMPTNSLNEYKKWGHEAGVTNRPQAISWVTQMQEAVSRGGMSSSSNNQVIDRLFRELSKRWAKLAREHIDKVASRCKQTISQTMLERTTRYDNSVANKIETAWIHPHLDANLEEVRTTLGELEKDTFLTLKAYTPRLEALKEKKIGELYAEDPVAPSSKNMAAIVNLMHVLAYYEVDLEYWITAVIKQVAERFVRCIPKALSSELILELSNEEISQLMMEGEGLARERKMLEVSVNTLEFALVKLDAQLKCLRQT